MNHLRIQRPDDWHVHLRDGAALKAVVGFTAQRFGYRQLMYYVVVRSISTAMRGPFVGWGKLERMGTVTAEHT